MKKRWRILSLLFIALLVKLLARCSLYLWQTYDAKRVFVSLYEVYAAELLLIIIAGAILVCWERSSVSEKYRRIRLVSLIGFYLFIVFHFVKGQWQESISAYYIVGLGEVPPQPMAELCGLTGYWIGMALKLASLVCFICYIIARIKDGKISSHKTDDASVS